MKRRLIATMLALASGCGVPLPARTPSALPSTAPCQAAGWTPVAGTDGLAVCVTEPNHLVFRLGSQADKTVTIPLSDDTGGPILKAYRVSDDKVFVERHINPHRASGVLCDLRKKTASVFYGTGFAIDQHSLDVAYWCEPQTNQEEEPGQVFVSGRLLLSLAKRDCRSLKWGSEGELLVTISDGSELELYPPGHESPADADK